MSIASAVRKLFPENRLGWPQDALAPTGEKSEYELRVDGENLLRAAIAAVEPRARVEAAMESRARSVPREGRVFVAGFGAAAVPMARGLYAVFGERIHEATLIVPAGAEAYVAPGCDIFRGGHPVPDAGCAAGARAIRQMAREAGPDDLLVCLISGGGSSLLTLPPDDLPLEDVQAVTARLLAAGAETTELDCVLRHLDVLKGGQLAREAAPARVLGLVLSDAPDGTADGVACGPLSPDPTRFADAVAVLKRHGVWSDVPLAARGWFDRGLCGEVGDTPQAGDPLFLRASTVVVGNAELAARAACEEAARRGYEAQVLTTALCGTASEAGVFLAESARAIRAARRPGQAAACLVTTGLTTLAQREHRDRVGRNQELALSAARRIEGLDGVLVASMNTCGVDGPTAAAGATVTGGTARRAAELGLDCERALERGESHALLSALEELIVSGPTGTPVGDIQIVLLA